MKQQYNSGRRGGINLLNLLGFAFAVILTVGFIKKTDSRSERSIIEYDSEESTLRSSINELYPAEASAPPVKRTAKTAARSYSNSNRIDDNSYVAPKVKRISIENWINDFDDFAKNQALKNGIPAGISLAMGINILDNGIPIRSEDDYLRLIVEPLTHLKKNAPFEDRSAYFKYAANSKKWADGLGASGRYSSSNLRKAIRYYRLDIFDREVRDYIVNAPSNSPALERKVEYVAAKARDQVAEKEQKQVRHVVSRSDRAEEWTNNYQDVVGQEVAKEVARKKLKTGNYITEEDMQQLIEETNAATDKAMENKLMFMGRKINKEHQKADEVSDMTKAKNSQARGEKYQKYVKSKRKQ